MKNAIAQVQTNIGPPINGLGPLGTPGGSAPTLFARILSTMIGIITAVAFIWFLFLLITGAIGIMSGGGDKARLEAAKSRITTGFIGVVVVIAGVFILDLVAGFLGIPGILNIAQIIANLTP